MIDCGFHSLLPVCKGGLIPLKFMDLTLVSFKFTCLFVSCISSVAPCCRLHEHSLPSCFASSSVFCLNDSHYHKCSTSQKREHTRSVIGCVPSSLVPHASCMLLWWQENGYWVHRGEIPVRQMMCPVHFVFHNPLAKCLYGHCCQCICWL